MTFKSVAAAELESPVLALTDSVGTPVGRCVGWLVVGTADVGWVVVGAAVGWRVVGTAVGVAVVGLAVGTRVGVAVDGGVVGPAVYGAGGPIGSRPHTDSRTGSTSSGLPPWLNHSDVLWCPMSGL
jgi:hypothetical protein